jgi:molecular chaperone GrpE
MATEKELPGDEQEAEGTASDAPMTEDQVDDASAAAGEDQMAALAAENADLKDQLLRAVAETENVRNRARRDREESLKYASTALVRDLLGVVDNLQRALSSIPESAAEENEQLKTLMTGVKMTEQELLTVFERHHIKVLDPLDEAFNPHQHEAMFEVPDASKPAGTVLQVLQSGYQLHDRLLRPARVGVAKAAPQGAEAESAKAKAEG